MNQEVQFHFSHEDIYKGGKDGKTPLYFLPLTSVTPMNDDYFISNLNTCQTNAAKNRGVNSFNENKNRISDDLKQTGITEKDLNDFINQFHGDKRNPMILLKECFEKLDKKCAIRYMNYNGYADKDFVDVLRDDEINFLYSFTDGTGCGMDVWGDNFNQFERYSLKTILHDKDDPKTVNLAKNFWAFLNQGEKNYELKDFELLKQDVFIEACKGSKKDDDEFTIYDEKGKLNEAGQLIYRKLCENISHRISPQKILQHLKDKKTKDAASAFVYTCREIEDYIDLISGSLVDSFNKDKFFPEEIYKTIETNNGHLNDSFATIHYFQCIASACIMHFLEADKNIRKNIIDGIIKVRTDFEKMTLNEFESSEYALNLAPDEKVKFIIKKFCGNDISEDVLKKILNTTTSIYAALFSNEARQVALLTYYHTTQFTFLNSKDLFIEKNGEVKVTFPVLYEVVTGKKLKLSKEVMEAYTNFDTSNPELFDYEVTIDRLRGKEINDIPDENLVENIALFRSEQLRLLQLKKILNCISYVQDPNRSYSNERKNGLLRVFVNIKSGIINYLTVPQIIELWDYMDIDINDRSINDDKLRELVNYIKRNNNVPNSLAKKVFKWLTNYKQVKQDFINDEEFFAKIVEFQDVIEFNKFFGLRYGAFRTMIDGVVDDSFDDSLLNNFLVYLDNNISNANVQRLAKGPFLNLYCDKFFKTASIEKILEFFSGVDRRILSKFPNKKVAELIEFIRKNETHQNAVFAKSILMQKVKYYPEFILYFTPEEIEINYNSIGARTLKYLNEEKFTNLINYFLDKKSIGNGWLKKILATSYFNKDLFKTIQPKQILDLIIYCQIITDDSKEQERLKLYFNDLCPNSGENVDFLKYVAGKVSEIPKYILKIVPQAINYVLIEQIYDKFDYFSDLIDEKFTNFNDLVEFVYNKKDDNNIKILKKILKNNPIFINKISSNEILLDLMAEDEELLNVVVPNIESSKFSLLMRFGKDNYSVNMPENIKLVFLMLITGKKFTDKSFYNFDFESRIFATKFYFDSTQNKEEAKTLLKKFLLDRQCVLETIAYVKNNSSENSFVSAIKEVISSEFKELPVEAMLELSKSDENYKNQFISIFPDNISDANVFMEILDKYKDLIVGMLQNESFKIKMSDYINSKITNDNLLELCKISNEKIKDLISKEIFMNYINYRSTNLNIMVSYFNKYVDDLSDEILINAFKNNCFSVVRAVSDKRFKEIFLKLGYKEEILFVRYRSSMTETEIKDLTEKYKNNVSSLLEELDKKIKAKKESEVIVKSGVEMRAKAEEANEAKIEDKNELGVAEDKNIEEKTSHKKRNVALIISGIAAISVSITLLSLALLGFLSFGIGLGIAAGLFAIGTLITGFASKFFDNEKIDELRKREPKTYTKTEKVLYGWRKPIKERIKSVEQIDGPKLSQDFILK